MRGAWGEQARSVHIELLGYPSDRKGDHGHTGDDQSVARRPARRRPHRPSTVSTGREGGEIAATTFHEFADRSRTPLE